MKKGGEVKQRESLGRRENEEERGVESLNWRGNSHFACKTLCAR